LTSSRHALNAILLVSASTTPLHADDVDDFVQATMRPRHIPAVSIAVIKEGVVVKTASYGVADIEHDTASRLDTVYKIGSMSKQFIAAGVMLLAQDHTHATDNSRSDCVESRAWVHLEGRTVRERRRLDGASSERRISLDGGRHGEVGSRSAVRRDSRGIFES